MHLGFGCFYKFVMFYFLLFFFQKAENNRLKKASWPKFCNIIFLFLLKTGQSSPQTNKLAWSRLIIFLFPVNF